MSRMAVGNVDNVNGADSGLESKHELNSWKEIGAYLGVQPRTAQRWETEKGLPVRRYPGVKGRVSATIKDLEKWKQENATLRSTESVPNPFRLLANIIIVILVVGAILGLGYWLNHRPGPPAHVKCDQNVIIVQDNNGIERWRHPFLEKLLPSRYEERVIAKEKVSWCGDLDGDSSTEVLFIYQPVSSEKVGSTLYCFDEDGKENWRWKPSREVADQQRSYNGVYSILNLAVEDIDRDGLKEILVTSHHFWGSPNQFAVLDSAGHLKAEHWHPGHLPHLEVSDLNQDGYPEILLGGVNNGYEQATLVVLDPRRIAGASATPEGNPSQLIGFPKANEEYVVLFPRTCINKNLYQYNLVYQLVVGETINVSTCEEEGVNPVLGIVIYELNRRMDLLNVIISDHLKGRHRILETERKLDHPYSDSEQETLRQSLIYLKRPPLSSSTDPKQSRNP
jgi:hypothetical protein